jgi:hypothetical protein
MSATEEPKNFFYFSDHNSHISITDHYNAHGMSNFAKGFGFMCWFRLEEFNSVTGPGGEQPLLFSIFSQNHGGMEAYFEDNCLFYRTLDAKPYRSPPDPEAINLGEFNP